MSISHSGFHAKDGWYFERQSDGSVKISAAVERCTETITVDASSWASIVASVSKDGESSDTYHAALQAHGESATTDPTPEA